MPKPKPKNPSKYVPFRIKHELFLCLEQYILEKGGKMGEGNKKGDLNAVLNKILFDYLLKNQGYINKKFEPTKNCPEQLACALLGTTQQQFDELPQIKLETTPKPLQTKSTGVLSPSTPKNEQNLSAEANLV